MRGYNNVVFSTSLLFYLDCKWLQFQKLPGLTDPQKSDLIHLYTHTTLLLVCSLPEIMLLPARAAVYATDYASELITVQRRGGGRGRRHNLGAKLLFKYPSTESTPLPFELVQ